MTAEAYKHSPPSRGVLLTTLLMVSCVPHVAIEGAPCPCADGYQCCETLSQCIDNLDTCPDTYPPSSGTPCSRNSDCPNNEFCQAWSIEDGSTAGPMTCRVDCFSGPHCVTGEVCELAPQDGTPLAELQVIPMCTDEIRMEGCESVGCQDCDMGQLGQTFCQGRSMHACFLGVHPMCGLSCSSMVVQPCGDAGCMDSGGSVCNSPSSNDPCVDFACSLCPNPAAPNEVACGGTDQVVGCVTASFAGGSCNSICETVSWECSALSVCVEQDGARCVP